VRRRVASSPIRPTVLQAVLARGVVGISPAAPVRSLPPVARRHTPDGSWACPRSPAASDITDLLTVRGTA
jgi:hypothetical protein